jgi:subtilisin family serine protease
LTTGTSVAAAHVSGTVALLLDREPRLDAAAVLDVLISSARDVVHQGRNDQFGYGIVDPQQALKALDAKVARGWTPAPEPAAKPGPISAR